MIIVEDTGPGVDESDRERIFGEFEQAWTGLNRLHEGIGLGLAISRRIAEAAGGSIGLDSTPDNGACFTIRYPVADTDHARARATVSDSRPVAIAAPIGIEAALMAETLGDAGVAANHVTDAGEVPLDAQTILVDNRIEGGASSLLDTLGRSRRLVALIEARERNTTGARFKEAGHAFLTRPVRPASLLRVVQNRDMGAAADRRGPKPKERNAPRLPQTGLNVLVAEDNPVNALLTLRMLERLGHRVRHVDNGEDAVGTFRSSFDGDHSRYDLLLMDLHMPGLDGIEAISAIRRTEDESQMSPVPVLVLTADASPETHRAVLAAGADGILIKPLDQNDFSDKISRIKDEAA